MLRSRTASWRTACPALALAALLLGGIGLRAASALELGGEPLAVAEEQTNPEEDVVGESVGEPMVEDAPVEGEPGPGETVRVPLDDPDDAGDAGENDAPTGEDNTVEQKPAD